MSTIHGAKGGEADKVLLMQDLTTQHSKHLVMTQMNYIDYFILERRERSVNCTSWTQKILIELIYYENTSNIKRNTREREIIQNAFMDCVIFLDKYEDSKNNEIFPRYAVDKTQFLVY